MGRLILGFFWFFIRKVKPVSRNLILVRKPNSKSFGYILVSVNEVETPEGIKYEVSEILSSRPDKKRRTWAKFATQEERKKILGAHVKVDRWVLVHELEIIAYEMSLEDIDFLQTHFKSKAGYTFIGVYAPSTLLYLTEPIPERYVFKHDASSL